MPAEFCRFRPDARRAALPRHQSRAGIGEDTAATKAFEQRDVEFALQQFDASADGGLRAVQRRRRTAEAAPAGYSHERPDLVHVHGDIQIADAGIPNYALDKWTMPADFGSE